MIKPLFCLLVAISFSLLCPAQNEAAVYQKAKQFYDASKPDSATILLNQILANKTAPYKLRSDVYDVLGHIELDKGNLPGALNFYLESEKIGVANSDVDITLKSAVNISGIYREQNNLPTARQYIDKAESDIDKVTNKKVAASFYNNKGILLEMNNQFDSAIDTYGKALDIYIAEKDSNHIAIGYNNLGIVYKNKGDYQKGLENYKKVVEIEKLIGNKYILGATYINIGNVCLKLKKYDDAIAYSKLGRSIATEISAQYLIVSAAETIAEVFFEKKLFDSAYAWQKLRFSDNEKYLNAENSSQVNEMHTKYETEKKEQTIALQQSKLSKQKLLLTGSIVLFALLSLTGWLLYRRYKLKKEKELQATLMQQREEATINILTAEEKECKRIAADLHDGVGQLMTAAWLNLQVLEKQLQSNSDEQQLLLGKTTLLVGESCKEVRQVSHNMMPNALLKQGLINALREFTQQIDKSVIAISLVAEGLETELDSITETILYRVVQECVNNTIKHASASNLDISVHNSSSGIHVLIEDNGKGFNVSTTGIDKNGLGLQNIRSRISFLKGTVDWDSSPGNGTVVAIQIPPKQ